MSAVTKKFMFLLGVLSLIVLSTLWVWAGTAQGASIDVTKTDDTNDGVCDADCSLREAITAASSGDTINISIGEYTLTLGTELVIAVDLTLNGAGSGDTIIQAAISSADATSRVFNITSGTVAISGVAVQNGHTTADGGGILNSGTLTLTNSIVSSSSAQDSGGGISNDGTLTLTNTSTMGSRAGDDGGGIHNTGTLTMTGSTVRVNVAQDTGGIGGGGGIYNDGTLTLGSSTVSNNQVLGVSESAGGGGIYNYNGGTLAITNSEVSGNDVGGEYAVGGGIHNYFGSVEIVDSTISGNTTRRYSQGGGIYSIGGSMSIDGSTISGNKTDWGGGGIYNESTDLTVLNSTFSGNFGDAGSGIYHTEFFAPSTTIVNISHTTITRNKALELGGGLYFSFAGEFNLSNTIIADNRAPTGPDCYNNVPSQGFNLIGNGTGCSFIEMPSDLVGDGGSPVDPTLLPLRPNGGPTYTHAFRRASPVLDAIPIAECNDTDGNPVATDQRGLARPQGIACDIGAYEQMEPQPVIEKFLDTSGNPVALAFSSDDRLFFTEQDGAVRVVEGTTDTLFYHLPSNGFPIFDAFERGLLGIEIREEKDSLWVWVFYSHAGTTGPDGADPDRHRVLKIRDEGGVGVDATVMIDDLPAGSPATNHNGGNIHFGPDGFLYVSMGDNGDRSLDAQDKSNDKGSILRFVCDPGESECGPAVGNPFPENPRLWAIGLRNSFDFTFQESSGLLYSADVGPTDFDEINVIEEGNNYGWPCRSGLSPGPDANNPICTAQEPADFTNPIWTFNPIVTPVGVDFYSGDKFPQFTGRLFVCEYNTSNVRYFEVDSADPTLLTDLGVIATNCRSDIQEGPDGYIYYTDFNAIYRIIN